MTFEKAIFTRTTADAAVAALIGTRLYYGSIPQKPVRPCVVYKRDFTERYGHLEGAGTVRDCAYTFTVHADSPETCGALAEALADVWDSYAGTITSGLESRVVLDSRIDDEMDEDFAPRPGREAGTYEATVDIVVGFRVTAPTH